MAGISQSRLPSAGYDPDRKDLWSKRLVEVGHEVARILNSDRVTYQPFGNARSHPFLWRQFDVAGCGRRTRDRFDRPEVGGPVGVSETGQKMAHRICAADQFEAHDAAEPSHLTFCHRVARVASEARVVNLSDRRVG